MADLLKDYFPAILSLVALVVWLVRLEGRVTSITREMIKLEKHLASQRAEDLVNRQRDWDMLSRKLDGIDSDLKLVLQRIGK